MSPAGWLPRTRFSSWTLLSVIEYGLPLPYLYGGGEEMGAVAPQLCPDLVLRLSQMHWETCQLMDGWGSKPKSGSGYNTCCQYSRVNNNGHSRQLGGGWILKQVGLCSLQGQLHFYHVLQVYDTAGRKWLSCFSKLTVLQDVSKLQFLLIKGVLCPQKLSGVSRNSSFLKVPCYNLDKSVSET